MGTVTRGEAEIRKAMQSRPNSYIKKLDTGGVIIIILQK